MFKQILSSVLGVALVAASVAVAQAAPDMPPLVTPLPKPDAEGQIPRATVLLAPYRYDDILWENDRTAHRIYGHALEAAEPPSSSGIDAWGKNVRWPYMDRQLRTGRQHEFHGEGLDFYDVNTGRGAGGLGVWQDNKLWVSRNWQSYQILKNGPDVASFRVDYAPWPVDVGRTVWESRTFTLPLGTNFTRMVSTINSDKQGPLIIGIGINKRRGPSGSGVLTKDLGAGRVSYWEPTDPVKGTMGIAVMVDPTAFVDVRQDFDNYLVLIKVEPGKPFVYYMGAVWDKGLDFHDRAAWESYVKNQAPSFDPAVAGPSALAAPQSPRPDEVKAQLGLDLSIRLARGAIEACRAKGHAVSASVVDGDGVAQVLLKSDASAATLNAATRGAATPGTTKGGTATPGTVAPSAATLKAATAVAFDAPGSEMEKREKADPEFARLIAAQPDRFNAHGGSLPLHRDGKIVGGLAVADTLHDVADACARESLDRYAKGLK